MGFNSTCYVMAFVLGRTVCSGLRAEIWKANNCLGFIYYFFSLVILTYVTRYRSFSRGSTFVLHVVVGDGHTVVFLNSRVLPLKPSSLQA